MVVFHQNVANLEAKRIAGRGKSKVVSVIWSIVVSDVRAATVEKQPQKGTSTKYMAKQIVEEKKMKQLASEAQQGGGGNVRKKATTKKNELRN